MKAKVYIETTIPSYLAARPSRDLILAAHQQITREWWEERKLAFDSFASELVLQEAAAGDPVLAAKRLAILAAVPLLAIDDSMIALGESLVVRGAIPRRSAADAVHIAIASAYACDYLLTWNCRHLANAEISRIVRRVLQDNGFDMPVICTPEELMGGI